MTQEVFTPTPLVTISGTGPYTILHGYDTGALVVAVIDGGTRTVLSTSDYSVTPVSTSVGGDLTLTAGAATAHDGKQLEITRDTVIEQGFAGQTSREVGLEAQLDWIVRAAQDLRRAVQQTLRTSSAGIGFLPIDRADRVLGFDAQGQPVAGPTFGAIEGSQAAATAAGNSATAAAASAAAAAGVQTQVEVILDTFDDRFLGLKSAEPTTDNDGNPLVAGALYFNSTTNMMRIWNGTEWQNFGNDISLAALKVNNLSDLPNADAALTNLGATAAGKAILLAANAAAQRLAMGIVSATEAAEGLVEAATSGEMAAGTAGKFPAANIVKAWAEGLMLGVGQTWNNYASSGRTAGTSYQNTTGKPIFVSIAGGWDGVDATPFEVSNNGSTWFPNNNIHTGGTNYGSAIIPNNGYYRWNGGSITAWTELR